MADEPLFEGRRPTGRLINRPLTLVRCEGESAIFCGGMPIYRCDPEDMVAG